MSEADNDAAKLADLNVSSLFWTDTGPFCSIKINPSTSSALIYALLKLYVSIFCLVFETSTLLI
jgi:hypothetical protein